MGGFIIQFLNHNTSGSQPLGIGGQLSNNWNCYPIIIHMQSLTPCRQKNTIKEKMSRENLCIAAFAASCRRSMGKHLLSKYSPHGLTERVENGPPRAAADTSVAAVATSSLFSALSSDPLERAHLVKVPAARPEERGVRRQNPQNPGFQGGWDMTKQRILYKSYKVSLCASILD